MHDTPEVHEVCDAPELQLLQVHDALELHVLDALELLPQARDAPEVLPLIVEAASAAGAHHHVEAAPGVCELDDAFVPHAHAE